MKLYDTREIYSKYIWEKFLLSGKPGTFLQSWNWGETNKTIGYRIKRLGFYKKDVLSGCALMIHQPAKRGPHYLIPGGPVLDYKDKGLLKYILKYIKEFAENERVWFVRIRPDIKEDNNLRKYLGKIGLNPAPMHVHGENTLVLDIGKSEEDILKNMRKTTRYLIRKSLNQGFSIDISTDEEKALDLYKLQKETVKRHGFVGFKKDWFISELKVFAKDGQALLFECKKDKELLSSSIVVFYANKAFYHFSASSQSSLRTNASYYLQWQIIKKAKELGLKYYDLWGIAARDDPKHRFWGVTVFKKGFGGERVDWLHAHDLPIRSYYWLTYFFESLRRGIRHL